MHDLGEIWANGRLPIAAESHFLQFEQFPAACFRKGANSRIRSAKCPGKKVLQLGRHDPHIHPPVAPWIIRAHFAIQTTEIAEGVRVEINAA